MIVSPATENVLGDADLTTVMAGGDGMAVMVAEEGAETTCGPVGGSPLAVAVLVTDPASNAGGGGEVGGGAGLGRRPLGPGWRAGR